MATAISPTACAAASVRAALAAAQRALTRAERYELQQHLAARGFDVGEPDGRLGGRSRNALRQFQSSVGAVPDGFASGAVLERLRGR
jgi:peptidoglycan hydrolase-like protein with peptidoglycan-binding domain